MLIPDPRRTPLPNLISHNGVILYQWEFLRARLDEGEGLPWIAMDYKAQTRAPEHQISCACRVFLLAAAMIDSDSGTIAWSAFAVK